MDLPISITSAVAETRRQDFISEADDDRTARLARPAGRQGRSHLLARFAAAVLHRHSPETLRQFPDLHEHPKFPDDALDQIATGTQQRVTDECGVRQIELYR